MSPCLLFLVPLVCDERQTSCMRAHEFEPMLFASAHLLGIRNFPLGWRWPARTAPSCLEGARGRGKLSSSYPTSRLGGNANRSEARGPCALHPPMPCARSARLHPLHAALGRDPLPLHAAFRLLPRGCPERRREHRAVRVLSDSPNAARRVSPPPSRNAAPSAARTGPPPRPRPPHRSLPRRASPRPPRGSRPACFAAQL